MCFLSVFVSVLFKVVVGGILKFLKFFFQIDKKVNNFFLFVLKIEFFRILRFGDRGDGKEDIKIWVVSNVICIMVDIMSNVIIIMISVVWSVISFIFSEDVFLKIKWQIRKVIERVSIFYVVNSGRGNEEGGEMNGEDGKSNDVIYRKGVEEYKVIFCVCSIIFDE